MTVENANTPLLAVDATAAAKMCGISRTLWYSLKSSGQIPKPIRLGRRTLWRTNELERWVAAGCPPLHRWEKIKDNRP